jgi:hypothetical protein
MNNRKCTYLKSQIIFMLPLLNDPIRGAHFKLLDGRNSFSVASELDKRYRGVLLSLKSLGGNLN